MDGKFVEIPIGLSNKIKDDNFIIIFNFNKRDKNVKYIKDQRYNIYDNFESKIIKRRITLPTFEFIVRHDYSDRIEIIYKFNDIDDRLRSKYSGIFIVSGWIPKNAGCEYCRYKEKNKDILFNCKIKDKIISSSLKNCKYFKQREYL